MSSSKAIPSPEEEPSELARFRAEWRAELESRKRSQPKAGQAPGIETVPAPGPSSSKATGLPFVFPVLRPKEQGTSSANTFNGPHPGIAPDGRVINPMGTRALDNALRIYRQAVFHEQAGDLDEALSLYRQAFRVDSHVDRAYHREEMLLSIAIQQAGKKPASSSALPSDAPSTQPHGTNETDDVIVPFQRLSIKSQTFGTGQAVVSGTLSRLVAKILGEEPTLTFKPEDEMQPVTINVLPEEILLEIIHMMDPSTIEQFARVCRKSRILTLESSIWRSLVISTYKEPQIVDVETLPEVITRYMFDYRRLFIEEPRIRMDGVYIAICHYIRPGASENHWVNITHLITYHRYLRFYPNGQVLSLLANEEHPPQTIINVLKPSFRMKGLYIGTWSLSGTTVILSNLFDASGRYPIPGLIESAAPLSDSSTTDIPTHHHRQQHHHHHSHAHATDSPQPSRYVFVMSLNLRSKPVGRWNRLDIQSYDTLNLETGDLTPVALKHERPFWFSKVKSYA